MIFKKFKKFLKSNQCKNNLDEKEASKHAVVCLTSKQFECSNDECEYHCDQRIFRPGIIYYANWIKGMDHCTDFVSAD